MPIFISYNHEDKEVAENLAIHLVQAKKNVWIDKWELNAGDSLIERIEEGLGGADAILVLLSKNSVESEWCKKELRSGLLRELEEKSVLIIPILLDDCNIPLFLREKLHIDFRKNRDEQLEFLLRSLDRISNPSQARSETPDYHIDWSMASVSKGHEEGIEWVFVDHSEKLPYVVMTQVLFWPTGASQSYIAKLPSNEAKFFYSSECMKIALENEGVEIRVMLQSSNPVVLQRTLSDREYGGEVDIFITTRKMGADNGMDTLVDVGENLSRAITHTLGTTRNR